jgi:sulfite reductase (NADPH) hemoprotein beta-component
MPDVIAKVIDVFVRERQGDEKFIEVIRRVGISPFKEHVYASGQAEGQHA